MITVCVIEPPVLHSTENVLPKKITARDNDTETEMSSRAQHRSVCATGGRKEVLCTSEGRLHTVQQNLLPAVEAIHIPWLARSKMPQKVNPCFQEKAKRCVQRD